MSLKKTGTVLRWEFLQKIKSKGFIFSIFFIPLVVGGFAWLPMKLSDVESREIILLGVYDPLGLLNAETFQNSGISISDYSATELDSFQIVMIVKKGFLTGFVKITSTESRTLYSNGNESQLEILKLSLDNALLKNQLQKRGIQTAFPPMECVRLEKKDANAEQYVTAMLLVIMLYFSITHSAGSLLRGLSEERSNRVLEVLLTSVSPRELMGGKIFGIGLAGLLQIIIWLVFGYFIKFFDSMQPIDFMLLTVYFLLGYFFYAGIYASLGVLFSTESDVQPIQAILSVAGMIPVALALWVIQSPDSEMLKVITFIPFLTPTLMPLRNFLSHPPVWEIILTIITQSAFVIMTLVMAGKLLQRRMWMQGKKFSLRFWRG